jgi:hypothetical protein
MQLKVQGIVVIWPDVQILQVQENSEPKSYCPESFKNTWWVEKDCNMKTLWVVILQDVGSFTSSLDWGRILDPPTFAIS